MRRILLIFVTLLATSLPLCSASAQTRDVPGAKDYPGIGRFGGSVITGYQVKDFDATRLQAAAFKNGKAADERKPEGRITRIAYRTTPGSSIVEVSRNFETQLEKAGFETLVACDTDVCGIPFSEAVDSVPAPQMCGRRFQLPLLRRTQSGGWSRDIRHSSGVEEQ
jgi:OOP family OmpA-OmpF porin